ncbi:MAG: putative nucleic acid-binding Zn-ribbon protein [Sphingobacteriales bacterium]|jgi:predicted  nucleic acid-binding Zn-ribbon protein
MDATVEEKLQALWDLQQFHSKIDNILTIRGELPIEVNDLEDEIAGLETRVEKSEHQIDDVNTEVTAKKDAIKDSQALIKKYEKQQMNVKNSKEYDAFTNEIELQTLEIQVNEKKIKEFELDISRRTEELDLAKKGLEERKTDLSHKKSELDSIIAETEKDEESLNKKAEKASKLIEERLLNAYNRVRINSKNGLGVVAIERNSCSGCFSAIPPQRQSEIRQRKKVIVCEHCGRILIDEEYANPTEKA